MQHSISQSSGVLRYSSAVPAVHRYFFAIPVVHHGVQYFAIVRGAAVFLCCTCRAPILFCYTYTCRAPVYSISQSSGVQLYSTPIPGVHWYSSTSWPAPLFLNCLRCAGISHLPGVHWYFGITWRARFPRLSGVHYYF
jgi:hypothetical protein